MSTPQRNDRYADYVPVAERLEKFYQDFPDGRIVTAIVEHNIEVGFILMRAEVFRRPDDASPAATGHAFEERSGGPAQRTSYIEVCETSAVGRALALLGFEVKRGIASREEMQKAARQEQQPGPRPVETPARQPESPPADRKEQIRDKRAQGIAAMGLVSRDGEGFAVEAPRLRGQKRVHRVSRDAGGKVVCSCEEYAEESAVNPAYRCEHVLAVKHALTQKAAPAAPSDDDLRSEIQRVAGETNQTEILYEYLDTNYKVKKLSELSGDDLRDVRAWLDKPAGSQ